MDINNKKYRLDTKPIAQKDAMVCGDKYRFTILTDYLIRLEYQKDGLFVDAPTQTVICREFPVPKFRVEETDEKLEIITDELHLYYDKKEFSSEGLFIGLKRGFGVGDSLWNYGDKPGNLGGTARTLDNADGAIELEDGLMSRDGFTVFDDSNTALLTEDGWAVPRDSDGIDMYFFGYGHQYQLCLRDFYRLSGATPLLPKYTLGNWWSRFYRYTEESYLELMKKFEEKKLPFSVSVIDMDWHITHVPGKYGSGWTGYTWNKELFPDPARFLKRLHEMDKHVTLNLHPADGVRAFEDAYLPMAKEMGVDYENEEKIPFDVMDRKYMNAYFKYLHHPYEEMGVDFWWVDWQQGSQSRTKGMDPLWMLNHLHFMDSGREGKQPLTFSRYAGLGSHRYPIGFSGDTITTWESLDFQPYFTVNASNAGYSWWSHDIGGHQKGYRDDEMVVRWIQFGVFSPIMRLHSTSNEFYGKEAWSYNPVAEKVITEFLQLRHKMIPYLHTMNYRTHLQGIPLMQPMYYKHDVPEAYEVPNQYYFGDMIVCPITKPADRNSLLASVHAWIPEGLYYDFFNGQVYSGNRKIVLYRTQETIPVLVPAGSIIPMAVDYEKCYERNPEHLDVIVFSGADGCFEMYEDDCSNTVDMEPVITKFCYRMGEMAKFSMQVTGDANGVIPQSRTYCVRIRGVESVTADDVQVRNVKASGDVGLEVSYDKALKEVIIKVAAEGLKQFELLVKQENKFNDLPRKIEAIRAFLHNAQMEYDLKDRVFQMINQETEIVRIVSQLYEMNIENELFGAILERLTSDF